MRVDEALDCDQLWDKLGPVFGRMSEDDMLPVTRALAVFLGIA